MPQALLEARETFDLEATRWLMRQVRDRLVEVHLAIDKREVTEDNGDLLIGGFASTGDVDRMDDIIDPQAFKRSASHFLANATILAHHSPTWPVGIPEDVDIREKGVWLKTRIKNGFDPTTPEGRAFVGVKLHLIRAYSVGFQILGSENIESAKAGYKIERVKRRITDLDWYETSVVTIPANRKTMFKLDKAVACGTDWPETMYADHRMRQALSLFGADPKHEEEEHDYDMVARAANVLALRAAAGNLAMMAPGALPRFDAAGEGG